MSTVLLHPRSISDSARAHMRDALMGWDRKSPIMLEEGAKLSVVGGMTVSLHLSFGPLEGVELRYELDSLDDLPDALPFGNGTYARWIADDGGQMRTMDGGVFYRWEEGG